MGADLLVYHVSILKEKKPDLKKGEARIDELEKTKPEDWPEYYCQREGIEDLSEPGRMEQVRQLRKDLNEFWCWIDPESRKNSREFTWIDVGPFRIWLTAGMSWGDPPTEAYSVLERLCAAGVTDAMGFDQDTNAVTIKVESPS